MSDEALPDYIVLRGMPGLPEGYMGDYEGRWIDVRDVPVSGREPKLGAGTARAWPTGRFETRDDGAVAEVWEVGP